MRGITEGGSCSAACSLPIKSMGSERRSSNGKAADLGRLKQERRQSDRSFSMHKEVHTLK